MSQPTYPIRTTRLTLRPFTLDDVDDVFEYQRRPDVVRWMLGAEPRTREESRAAVLAMAGEDALREENDPLALAVATDAGVIGMVELVWRSRVDRTAELGYVFHPDHGGRGLATEAVSALLDWGFTEFGLHRIYARCHSRNQKSVQLLTRLGMRQEARHVESYWFRGAWADRLVFAVLAREWRARQSSAGGAGGPGIAPSVVGQRTVVPPRAVSTTCTRADSGTSAASASSACEIRARASSGSRKKSPDRTTSARRPSRTVRSATTSLPPETLYSPCRRASPGSDGPPGSDGEDAEVTPGPTA